MRVTLFLLFCLLPFLMNGQSRSEKKVLFLGNSYTYVNNLPQLVSEVAASMGDTLFTENNCPGGYTFQNHSTNTTSLNMIMQGNWDFVVLQEQSQLPSFPINQVTTSCFPYAHLLDSIIRVYNPCSGTMFFMTWGRKNGDASNCQNWPPVCTYAGMDSLLRLRYQMMADSNDAVLSPVGAVWRYIRNHFPLVELYAGDESHPSEAGSYAAACTFYTAIFRKDPQTIPFTYTLTQADADAVKLAAKLVVFDSLDYWNIGKFDPQAAYFYNLQPDYKVQFTNASQYADHFYWDFNDGNTSTLIHPLHQYAAQGTYQVRLVAGECGSFDTIIQQVMVTPLAIPEAKPDGNDIKLFPNPADNRIFIEDVDLNGNEYFIRISNILGINILQQFLRADSTQQLDISGNPAGIYYISVYRDKRLIKILKFVKQ